MTAKFSGSTATDHAVPPSGPGRREGVGRTELCRHHGNRSGKSLCFFVPIIDAVLRARTAGEARRTRAIVVYPMNALANSQMNELQKFIEQSGLPDELRPTFARYTGQEDDEERALVQKSKPDILLTNFMMLELLMTRQNERDRTVIGNSGDLDFLVLDELHTYRGRQGADVAMLVRRVRDRLVQTSLPSASVRRPPWRAKGKRNRAPSRLPAWQRDCSGRTCPGCNYRREP